MLFEKEVTQIVNNPENRVFISRDKYGMPRYSVHGPDNKTLLYVQAKHGAFFRKDYDFFDENGRYFYMNKNVKARFADVLIARVQKSVIKQK